VHDRSAGRAGAGLLIPRAESPSTRAIRRTSAHCSTLTTRFLLARPLIKRASKAGRTTPALRRMAYFSTGECRRNCVGLSERDRYAYDYEKQDYHSQQQRVGA